MGSTSQSLERKAIGNYSTDRYLASQSSPFLRRNLRVVLDRHEKQLAGHSMPTTTRLRSENVKQRRTKAEAGGQFMDWYSHPREKLKAFLKKTHPPIPRTDQLREGMVYEAPKFPPARNVLIIKKLVIRLPNSRSQARVDSKFGDVETDDDSDYDDEELAILRRRKHSSIVCTISVRTNKHPIAGTMTGELQISDRRCEITFPTPFELPFEMSTPHGLYCRTSITNARQLGPILAPLDETQLLPIAGDYSLVSEEWLLPRFDHAAGIQRVESRKLYIKGTIPEIELYPVLDMALCWRRRQSLTPLNAFNNLTRGLYMPRALQLPTPDASQDLEHESKDIEIIYNFMDVRRHIAHNLHCPLCLRDFGFVEFDRLYLHLKLNHLYFTFIAEECIEDEPALHRSIFMAISDPPEARANIYGKDEEKINYIAPEQPFDIKAHLYKGETVWTQDENKKQRPMGKKDKKALRAQPVQTVFERLSAEKVRDVVKRLPAMHVVPEAYHPDRRPIQFYATGSKRPLKAGEVNVDSDDDIDDTWLKDKERSRLKKVQVLDPSSNQLVNLTPAQQEFHFDFNWHITAEERLGVSGDRLKRESVIRFARLYANKLNNPGWKAQFEQKLKLLRRNSIIDDADVIYCLETLVSGPVTVEESSAPLLPRKESRFTCICGERVDTLHELIRCENVYCAKDAYHMACFGLSNRPPDWRCPQCPITEQ